MALERALQHGHHLVLEYDLIHSLRPAGSQGWPTQRRQHEQSECRPNLLLLDPWLGRADGACLGRRRARLLEYREGLHLRRTSAPATGVLRAQTGWQEFARRPKSTQTGAEFAAAACAPPQRPRPASAKLSMRTISTCLPAMRAAAARHLRGLTLRCRGPDCGHARGCRGLAVVGGPAPASTQRRQRGGR